MTKPQHPRYIYFPWHIDYVRMKSSYRPFQMGLNESNYVSKAVNTDKHGLRLQFKTDGAVLALEDCQEGVFDIMVGGSSVFGVDASSDRSTLPSLMSTSEIQCLNWGVRGASTQQELMTFLSFKRYVPKIRRVIIFSGINLCSISSLKNIMVYPDQGALFSERFFLEQALETLRVSEDGDPELDDVLTKLNFRVKNACASRPWLRALVGLALSRLDQPSTQYMQSERNVNGYEKRVKALLALLANELETWSALAKGMGFQIVYVLQPALRWARKAVNHCEEECISADVNLYPEMELFANSIFYEDYAFQLSSMCRSLGIRFIDANLMLNDADGKIPVFTDVCHLTDYGNNFIAKKLSKLLGTLS